MKYIFILALAATLSFAADPARLQAMAKNANSQSAHVEVARSFTEYASELDSKAKAHEQEAARLAKIAETSHLKQKWPAMADAPAERERRLAMQARRAAHEARTIALQHKNLADPVQVTN